MFEHIDFKSTLIFGAVATYVLGFLFRGQIPTRLLVVMGSSLYIVYYSIAGPVPLWDAMFGSALIALASIQGVIRLWWSRMSIAVPEHARDIYPLMSTMEPGLFRQLINVAERSIVSEDTVLVRQGEPAQTLLFFIKGELRLERDQHPAHQLTTPGFIGEVAWMTKGKASATIIAKKGTEIVKWDTKALEKATQKSERLELALEALIAQDLAQKVASSRPIDTDFSALDAAAPV